MFLSINPLLPHISFIVTDGVSIVEQSLLEKNLDNASTFPRHLVDIIDRYDISEIWCVVGPWAFTLMRIVTLSVNAVWLARWISLRWVHFFDILGNTHTPILEANAREYIIRESESDSLIAKSELPPWSYMGIIETKDFTEDKTFVEYREDISEIVRAFWDTESTKTLVPIYFKAPHITCSNKKTSPSSETTSAS